MDDKKIQEKLDRLREGVRKRSEIEESINMDNLSITKHAQLLSSLQGWGEVKKPSWFFGKKCPECHEKLNKKIWRHSFCSPPKIDEGYYYTLYECRKCDYEYVEINDIDFEIKRRQYDRFVDQDRREIYRRMSMEKE